MRPTQLRRIDPNEPLADAARMRSEAGAILAASDTRLRALGPIVERAARAPVAPASTSRAARSFTRARNQARVGQPMVGGATRYYNRAAHVPLKGRHHAQRDFSATNRARALQSRTPTSRVSRMASGMLMAASVTPTMRSTVMTPRAEQLMILARRAEAMRTIGTLSYRFQQNVYDMNDGVANGPVMRSAQARFANARGLRPSMDY